jgi:hypothetical protein
VTPEEARTPFLDGFAAACASRPGEVHQATFSVGGYAVEARVVGAELAGVLARSLARGCGGPVLRLHLWDEAATEVPSGPRLCPKESGERHGPAGERLAFAVGSRHLRFSGPDFDIRLDRDRGHAVGWVRDAAALSSWHRARPLQAMLMPWLSDLGRTVVHAAMVARGDAGILLAGPSHSGKSTTAAICAAAGFQVLGDETIALQLGEHGVTGNTIHAAVKLRRDGLERHPALVGRTESCGPPWQDESVAFLGDLFPDQVVPSAQLVALGFPTLVDDPQTTFAPLRRGVALRVLTGCVLSVEPGNVTDSFEAIGQTVARVPAFRISIGRDTGRIPDALDDVIRAVRPAGDRSAA